MNQILKKDRANHWLNGEAVGGHLTLDQEGLFFASHRINFQPHVLTIHLADIDSVSFSQALRIAPNGLKIHMKNGLAEEFVVEDRAKWKELIEQHLEA